jgi:hypothetical protein
LSIMQQSPSCQHKIGLLAFVKDLKQFRERLENSKSQARLATVEVSNLGVVENVGEWFFAQGNHYSGAVFAVNVVSFSDRGMYITVTSKSTVVTREIVQNYAQNLLGILLQDTQSVT